MNGMFIEGIYCGGTEVVRDGKISYAYLVTDGGSSSWRVRSAENYLDELQFGDSARFKVRANAFNGAVYFSGTLDR